MLCLQHFSFQYNSKYSVQFHEENSLDVLLKYMFEYLFEVPDSIYENLGEVGIVARPSSIFCLQNS